MCAPNIQPNTQTIQLVTTEELETVSSISELSDSEYLEYLENRITLDDTFPNCPVCLEVESNDLYLPISYNKSITVVSECQCNDVFEKVITLKDNETFFCTFDIIHLIMENRDFFERRNENCKHSTLFDIKDKGGSVFELRFSYSDESDFS
jgi:hypothetical protein